MDKLVVQRIENFFKGFTGGPIWQRIWTKDWLLKLISLMLAAVLWYFVGGEDTVDKNVMVPIEIINMPRDLVISNQFKKEIDVTVSGPRSLIQEIANRDVTRQINLSDATPGTNVIHNTNDSIPVPRGITVLRIQPSSIILSLDKLIQRKFPITPVSKGEVASGYVLKSMKMVPDVITITGPQTILSQVDELRTDLIDITNMSESKQLQIPLNLEPAIVDLIGETSVTVEIDIGVQAVQKEFKNVDVVVSIDGVARKVRPDTVDVVANIPKVLSNQGGDLSKLFTVTAIPEEDGAVMQVKVIPVDGLEAPIEVVDIQPPRVMLVEKEQPKERRVQPLEENSGAAAPQKQDEANVVLQGGSGTTINEKPIKVITSDKKKILKTD